MKALIEANGGKNSSSISSKTSFLLAGSKPGPEKLKKCEALGVRIIDEESFMAMLPASPAAAEESTDNSIKTADSPRNEPEELTLFA